MIHTQKSFKKTCEHVVHSDLKYFSEFNSRHVRRANKKWDTEWARKYKIKIGTKIWNATNLLVDVLNNAL